ncbi:hypothetical protein GLE_1728 [Lysobacter enzymogenes]|uniref:Uncharacterized protein n=1 Tax=Lysobacter enzymogenes TaxID=69 RepID=A0A0S2DEK7_LYSEN|nr:hypothetical protein GLE_1728 [Lysobacter enzymogenes]
MRARVAMQRIGASVFVRACALWATKALRSRVRPMEFVWVAA